ncbi:hypothetical protein MY8738_001936 [Beauveria namnaoensis]
MPGIFTQAVLHFSIIASCVTTLKPFLRHFDPTYVLESADVHSSKRSRASMNASRDSYHRLGAINRVNRSNDDPNDKVNWRPYQGPTQAEPYAAAYHDSSATQSSQSSKESRLLRASRSIGANLRGVAQGRQDGAMQSKNPGPGALPGQRIRNNNANARFLMQGRVPPYMQDDMIWEEDKVSPVYLDWRRGTRNYYA